MGLDMYLHKTKRIGDATPEQLNAVNKYFYYLENGHGYSMKEWCEIGIEEVDMKLAELYKDEYIQRYSHWDTEKKYGWKTIFQQIASWRKANHIHKWFVDNVQDGEDDCGIYEVTKERFEKLRCICKEVLAASKLVPGKIKNGYRYVNGKEIPVYEDGKYIEDPSVARVLLPTQDGFFFGGTEYDQWYYQDVKDTVEIIEKVLAKTEFEHEIVMYSSSW